MKTYTVVIGGIAHTMQYSDAEAKALGLDPVDTKSVTDAPNKARGAKNKGA